MPLNWLLIGNAGQGNKDHNDLPPYSELQPKTTSNPMRKRLSMNMLDEYRKYPFHFFISDRSVDWEGVSE
jgi:hypothetical protein